VIEFNRGRDAHNDRESLIEVTHKRTSWLISSLLVVTTKEILQIVKESDARPACPGALLHGCIFSARIQLDDVRRGAWFSSPLGVTPLHAHLTKLSPNAV
jgi:hypothetical protein